MELTNWGSLYKLITTIGNQITDFSPVLGWLCVEGGRAGIERSGGLWGHGWPRHTLLM